MKPINDLSNVIVAVRCKPATTKDISDTPRKTSFIEILEKHHILLKAPQRKVSTIERQGSPSGVEASRLFTFDHVFSKSNSSENGCYEQQEIYELIGENLLDHALKGYNVCIFAYGQTGTGKTHTMIGSEVSPGIIPRMCANIFTKLKPSTGAQQVGSKNQGPTEQKDYKIQVSYYQIYNEKVYDLLSLNSTTPLKVREHPSMGPYIQDLTNAAVSSIDEIMAVLVVGNKRRVTSSTKMNESSSRSHAVFSIKLTQKSFRNNNINSVVETESNISLVDLAGSERVSQVGASGKLIKEGISINKSLTTLSKVTSALAAKVAEKKKVFVPYRDSVLTWLLKESLGGNSRTVIIATVSPFNYQDTLGTLLYAERAKQVVNFAVVNEDSNATLIDQLKAEVSYLKNQLSEFSKNRADFSEYLDNKQDYIPKKPTNSYFSTTPSPVSENKPINDYDYSLFNSKQAKIIYDKIIESEKLLREYCQPWEQKLRKTRTSYHLGNNLQYDQASEYANSSDFKPIIPSPCKVGFLVEFLSMPSQIENQIYVLNLGSTVIGGPNCAEADIKLKYEDTEDIENSACIYCKFVNDGFSGVKVYPQGCDIFVDDQQIKDPLFLPTNCNFTIGKSHTYRYIYKNFDLKANQSGIKLNSAPKIARPKRRDSEAALPNFSSHSSGGPALLKRSGSLPQLNRYNEDAQGNQSLGINKIAQSLNKLSSNDEAAENSDNNFDEPFNTSRFELENQEIYSGFVSGKSTPESCFTNSRYSILSSFVNAAKKIIELNKENQRLEFAKKILVNSLLLKEANIFCTNLGIKLAFEFCVYSEKSTCLEKSNKEFDGLPKRLFISESYFKRTSCDSAKDSSNVPSSKFKLSLGVKVFDSINRSISVMALDEFTKKVEKMKKAYYNCLNPNFMTHMNFMKSFLNAPVCKYTLLGSAQIPITTNSLFNSQKQFKTYQTPQSLEYPFSIRICDEINLGLTNIHIIGFVKISKSEQLQPITENPISLVDVVELVIVSIDGINSKDMTNAHFQLDEPKSFAKVHCLCSGEILCDYCSQNLYYNINMESQAKNYKKNKILDSIKTSYQLHNKHKTSSIRIKQSTAEQVVTPVVTPAVAFYGEASSKRHSSFSKHLARFYSPENENSSIISFENRAATSNKNSKFKISLPTSLQQKSFMKTRKPQFGRKGEEPLAKISYKLTSSCDETQYIRLSLFGRVSEAFISEAKNVNKSSEIRYQPNKLRSTGERIHENIWLTPKTHDLVLHFNLYEMDQSGKWCKVIVASPKKNSNSVSVNRSSSCKTSRKLDSERSASIDERAPTLAAHSQRKLGNFNDPSSRRHSVFDIGNLANLIQGRRPELEPENPHSNKGQPNTFKRMQAELAPPANMAHYFVIRQGLQRRVQVSLSHNSGTELDIEIKCVSFNNPRLVDSNGSYLQSIEAYRSTFDTNGIKQSFTRKVELREINQDKIKTILNNRSYCCFTGIWDSSLHGSDNLDTLTSENCNIKVQVEVEAEIKGLPGSLSLKSDIYLAVVDRDTGHKNFKHASNKETPANKPSQMSDFNNIFRSKSISAASNNPSQGNRHISSNLNKSFQTNHLLNSEVAKYLSQIYSSYQLTLLPSERKINLHSDLWRFDYSNVYVRGQELLNPSCLDWTESIYMAEKLAQKQEYINLVNLYKARIFIYYVSRNDLSFQILPTSSYFMYAERFAKKLYSYCELKKIKKVELYPPNEPMERSSTLPCLDLALSSCSLALYDIKRVSLKNYDINTHSGLLKSPDSSLTLWVSKWVVIQKPLMYIYTDKPMHVLENMINIRSARVEYSKNLTTATVRMWVFAVYTETSTFLFEAESKNAMFEWIKKIDEVFFELNKQSSSSDNESTASGCS